MLELATSGAWRVLWLDGGLYVGNGATGVLLDAPEGVFAALGPLGDTVDAVLLSGGRLRSVAGLVGVVGSATRTRNLRVWSVFGEERPGRLIDAVSAWEPPFTLQIDAEPPGAVVSVGPLEITTVSLRRAERGVAVPAVGFRVRGPVDVAFVPGGGPGARALCVGAELAVIEAAAGLGVDERVTHEAQRIVIVDEHGRIAGIDA